MKKKERIADRRLRLLRKIANSPTINDLYAILMREIKEIDNEFPDVPKWYEKVKPK